MKRQRPKKPRDPNEHSRIHCCSCNRTITARLTNGAEVYPNRRDLKTTPFWCCDTCGNFVGTHHKSWDPFEPLGCIPTPELRKIRRHVHAVIDPLWKTGRMTRSEVYQAIGEEFGREFHVGDIRSRDEAIIAYRAAGMIERRLQHAAG